MGSDVAKATSAAEVDGWAEVRRLGLPRRPTRWFWTTTQAEDLTYGLRGVAKCMWTTSSRWATIVAMSVEPLRSVRDHLSEVVERVEKQHERVTITRNGRAAAVLISPEDLAELEETLSVLSDPEAWADLREADASYARGDVVRGVDAVRALRR